MAKAIDQPSVNPTNKLSAAVVASAVVGVAGLALKNLYPEWYDPEVMLSVTPVIVWASGYVIRDKPNVVVTVDPEE